MASTGGRTLYPPIEPYASGLAGGRIGHRVYWERSGTPGATPAVFLHGGPGAGCSPVHRQLFDPARYDLLLFDQRGCGRSTPARRRWSTNTTWDLVADIERLRELAGVDRWLVFGGSWGSHARARLRGDAPGARDRARPARHLPAAPRGAALVLPGGRLVAASRTSGKAFLAPIPEAERGDLMAAYRTRLTGDDPVERLRCAKAWSTWEGVDPLAPAAPGASPTRYGEDDFALAFARIENHYFVHDAWLDEGQLLRDVDRIRHIPGVLIQGRYDIGTPDRSAWDLHRAWPEADLQLIPDAGHAFDEPGILDRAPGRDRPLRRRLIGAEPGG